MARLSATMVIALSLSVTLSHVAEAEDIATQFQKAGQQASISRTTPLNVLYYTGANVIIVGAVKDLYAEAKSLTFGPPVRSDRIVSTPEISPIENCTGLEKTYKRTLTAHYTSGWEANVTQSAQYSGEFTQEFKIPLSGMAASTAKVTATFSTSNSLTQHETKENTDERDLSFQVPPYTTYYVRLQREVREYTSTFSGTARYDGDVYFHERMHVASGVDNEFEGKARLHDFLGPEARTIPISGTVTVLAADVLRETYAEKPLDAAARKRCLAGTDPDIAAPMLEQLKFKEIKK
jgi:hypothetical protein